MNASIELVDELKTSKAIIESITGEKVIEFAIPGGIYNQKNIQTIRENGYTLIYSSDIGMNSFNKLSREGFVIKRLEVRGNTDLKDLLKPSTIRKDRLIQRIKELVRSIIGDRNYSRASERFFCSSWSEEHS